MKKFIFALALLLTGGAVSAQTEQTASDQVFMVVEQMPEFPGGDMEMRKFIATNIKYPEQALNEGISGTVYLRFVVDIDGSVTAVEVQKGVHEALDKEAVRVVELLPKFKPGMQRGQNVKVALVVPIKFGVSSMSPSESHK
ncbi:MAG: energy transducer TonB [Bacteroidales bacterium]|nr:energy transducer TonB [Bacteroidales bacterium]